MERNKRKISGSEKLQLQKDLLRKQIFEQGKVLDEHFSYLQENLGTLLLKATVYTLQDRLPPGIRKFIVPFLVKNDNQSPGNKDQEPVRQPAGNKFIQTIQMFGATMPVIVDLALPLLIKAGVRFLKKKFFKNKD